MNQTLCEHCRQREASVFYKQNIDGKETSAHLCAQCAKKLGVGAGFQGVWEDDFFGMPMLSQFFSAPKQRERSAACPLCGMTEEEIRKKGVFGCPECYESFSARMDLSPFIGKGYRGKALAERDPSASPAPADAPTKREASLSELKEALKEAIRQENYEQAAILRDQIRSREGA